MRAAMNKNICVFCSSSDRVDGVYADAAQGLGEAIAAEKGTLIFGGCRVGLMGHVARAAKDNGAKVIGVIPQQIFDKGITFDSADELIVTKDLRERKAILDNLSDVVVALPGGFGTLEEILETITLKSLQFHNKPVIFLNTLKFYDRLLNFFEVLFEQNFAKAKYHELFHVADTVPAAFQYLKTYQPKDFGPKWF